MTQKALNPAAVSPKRPRRLGRFLLEALAILLMLLVLSPFVIVFLNASKTYDQITPRP